MEIESVRDFLLRSTELIFYEMEKRVVVEASYKGNIFPAFFPASKIHLLKLYKEYVKNKEIDLLKVYKFHVKKKSSKAVGAEFEIIGEVDLDRIKVEDSEFSSESIEKIKKYVERKLEKHLLF
jgi:hypothetical protein